MVGYDKENIEFSKPDFLLIYILRSQILNLMTIITYMFLFISNKVAKGITLKMI